MTKYLACLILLLATLPLLAGISGDTTDAILAALAPLIIAIVTPLITRLFRKIGIDIADSLVEPILMRIIEIIAKVEKSTSPLSGAEKKAQVVAYARATLSKKDQNLLVKKYGSLETAVQAAFEKSSISLK